ncbi:hypothetical protein FGLOB1_5768 [Fusarium globosum]|uniref:DUF7770 domain-containing protein n=1 Tax=Fusarium globosum TaxID=78864 RepID=A0A8H6DC20_9HYPO|nr:hypothetical protein FGLOB1_5768 [Fusarium globosum]
MGCGPSSPSKSQGESSHTNFEMYNLNPLSYTPETAENEIRSSVVVTVHFVAHTIVEGGGNHWVISLQTAPRKSTRLEIVPGAYPGRVGFLGRLDIIRHPYGITRHSNKTVNIPAQPGHTVGHFLDAIVGADNHRYEFTQSGRGCGGWVRDQFYLFVQRGLLPPGWEAEFEAAINVFWVQNESRGPWPLTYGTYLRTRNTGRKGKGKGKKSKRQ